MTTSTTADACTYEGTEYVGLIVWPRGFANELRVYVARADNVAQLEGMIQRRRDREPGDDFDAQWMAASEVLGHIKGSRDSGGNIYLLTINAEGQEDSLIL